jgi:hypothetical protein
MGAFAAIFKISLDSSEGRFSIVEQPIDPGRMVGLGTLCEVQAEACGRIDLGFAAVSNRFGLLSTFPAISNP